MNSKVFAIQLATLMASLSAKSGGNYNGVVSQSQLRAEVDLVDATGRYELDFRSSKGGKQLTEVLLKENDLFMALDLRFNLGVRAIGAPTAYVPQTYPNKTIFVTETGDSPVGTFDADHLEAIYNAGYVQYKKGDSIYMPHLPLRGARFVGQTQQTSAANKSSTERNDAGIIALERPLSLIGTDIGELTLNIPGASNLKLQYSTVANLATKGLKIVAIVTLDGILASGGNKISSAASV